MVVPSSRTEELAIMQIEISYLDALLAADIDDQKSIVLARKYHEGKQKVYMDDRVKEFLALHPENPFRLNVCRTVVTAVKDELNVTGFDTSELLDDKTEMKAQAVWAGNIWNANHMDSIQDEVHEAAMRDRESFVIVDWDNDNKRPRFTHNQRFTDLSAGGDQEGCWILYENNDPHQPAILAVKQWLETITDANISPFPLSRIRRTLYYPDHVEKWVYQNGWQHYAEEGEEWPIPWRDKNGQPLGIPIVHFMNENLTPEAWDAIPMQDAINKTLVDILSNSDMSAFRSYKAFGWYPTTDGQAPKADGSNLLKFKPGQFVGSVKPPDQASMDAIIGEDVTPMVNTLKDLIILTAQITDTPVSRFMASGQIAGSLTLKEQEQPLKKKAADRRSLFGDAWQQCMVMARKLQNAFGTGNLDETIQFFTMWLHTESLDELTKKQALGVPFETIWVEMGYTREQIMAMKQTDEYRIELAKKLWDAAFSATQSGAALETFLQSIGWTEEDLQNMGTQKLAAIKLQQEDITKNPDSTKLKQ